MDWKMHMMIPLFIYIGIMLVFQMPVVYALQALFLLLFTAFLPDLDHPKSVMRRISFIVIFYLMVFAVTANLQIDMLTKFIVITILLVLANYFYKRLPLKHRGKHSFHLWRYFCVFPSVFGLAFVAANINISLVIFTIIGFGSHLAADKINKF
jgi:hypothetical protein